MTALLGGCGDNETTGQPRGERSLNPASASTDVAGEAARQAAGQLQSTQGGTRAPNSPANNPSGSSSASPAQADTARKLIRKGRVSLEVDSLPPAVQQVRNIAFDFGGYVAETQIKSGRYQGRRAQITLKLPNDQFDQATESLRNIGAVQQMNISTEDVTDRLVDLKARIRNQQRLEERLLKLVQERTGKLNQLLRVEKELSRVREQIERLQAQQRQLQKRVAMATLNVELRARSQPDDPTPDRPNVLVQAFQQAWNTFVGIVAGFIASLGWLAPLLFVLALGLKGGKRLWGRFREGD